MVKAKETDLEGVLEGKKQYQVPLYQRVYSWGRKQIDQLWTDLLDIAEVRRLDPTATHFIGSLVLAASPDNGAVGVQKYLVVDGQQRLTTLTLLLAALRDHQVETSGPEHRDRIDTQYLVNKYEKGQPAKVLPTQADRSAYLAVIRAAAQAGSEGTVGDAYRSFRSKIAAADDPDDPHDISEIENAVLRGLALVAVTAEAGDNAHRIFESLNNTGLKLTQADLLKNYLFMRLGGRAEAVYEDVWLPLEKKLDPDSLELLFWLDLVQTDETAKQSDTYVGQQRRLQKLASVAEIEQEIVRIARLGELLATILTPSREHDPEVRERLLRIREWGSTTAYPVVMQILGLRAAGKATNEQAARALSYLESYFVRRIIIGRATNGLNRSLLQAGAAVSGADEIDMALRRFLSIGRKYFATDAQVRDAVSTVAFYWQGRAAQKKLILQWLEQSFRHKERIDPGGLTIEHVLPQTLSAEVRDEFSADLDADADLTYEHERVVHTLGNLTLSGYNSELSNSPFSVKRRMLKESGLRMNQQIAAHDRWGVAEIEARGAELAERIIELWPGPDESLVGVSESVTELRLAVASIVAAIPPGRWTSYTEVALVVGTHPLAVGNAMGNYAMPNAWRVLQVGGTVAPDFHWTDPHRHDDPKDLLLGEGIVFDESGRASSEQFLSAGDLADLAGYDVDESLLTGKGRSHVGGVSALGVQQLEFWRRVREWGLQHAAHLPQWNSPQPQQWYDIVRRNGVSIELNTHSRDKRVGAEIYIYSDKPLFARLYADRAAVEADLGFALLWREMPDRKASRILVLHDGDFRDEAAAPALIEWLVSTADELARVFGNYL